MQLLERKDKLKWVVWTAQGKLQEADMNEDLDCSEFNIIFKEYYNRLDA